MKIKINRRAQMYMTLEELHKKNKAVLLQFNIFLFFNPSSDVVKYLPLFIINGNHLKYVASYSPTFTIKITQYTNLIGIKH